MNFEQQSFQLFKIQEYNNKKIQNTKGKEVRNAYTWLAEPCTSQFSPPASSVEKYRWKCVHCSPLVVNNTYTSFSLLKNPGSEFFILSLCLDLVLRGHQTLRPCDPHNLNARFPPPPKSECSISNWQMLTFFPSYTYYVQKELFWGYHSF